MSSVKLAALCFLTATFLAASVALHVYGKDGSGWGFMAFLSTILIFCYG